MKAADVEKVAAATGDLPWAIVRFMQRAGRVDRIEQKSNRILRYSIPGGNATRFGNRYCVFMPVCCASGE